MYSLFAPLFVLIGLFVTVLSGSVSQAAPSADLPPTAVKKAISPTAPLLRYENQLIWGEIHKIPLGKILEELQRRTRLQVYLNHSSTAGWMVSASLPGVPLAEGIKIILEGFSYALYAVENNLAVVVLSTLPENRSSMKEAFNPTFRAHLSNNKKPQSLDEFQLLTKVPAGEEDAEQHYQQALLSRALDVLNSEHEHLYEEALNQVTGVGDPQATQVLVTATHTGLGPVSRVQATEMLWQHAVNLQFEDESSIHALQQLAQDTDGQVSHIAHQALAEMQSMEENP